MPFAIKQNILDIRSNALLNLLQLPVITWNITPPTKGNRALPPELTRLMVEKYGLNSHPYYAFLERKIYSIPFPSNEEGLQSYQDSINKEVQSLIEAAEEAAAAATTLASALSSKKRKATYKAVPDEESQQKRRRRSVQSEQPSHAKSAGALAASMPFIASNTAAAMAVDDELPDIGVVLQTEF